MDDNLSTLMDFRYKRKYAAEPGVDGQGKRKSGKDGKSLTIRVPRGTLVRDAETNEIIQDMSGDEPFILCRGGKGGWGNAHFATPTRQAPRFAKSGLPGDVAEEVVAQARALACALDDAGDVGHDEADAVLHIDNPQVGKEGGEVVVGDLGLCPADHAQKGALADAINQELKQYSPELARRPQIVAANKTDIMADDSLLQALREHVEALGYPLFGSRSRRSWCWR